MPRLMTDDPTRTNPLALITTARMAAISDVVAPVNEYITASGDGTVDIVQNCVMTVGDAIFQTPAATLGVPNLDSGSSFQVGSDYYVYMCDNGTDNEVYLISLNSTYPAGYDGTNSRKIGGFHVGQARRVDSMMRPVNPGSIVYGSGWESNVYQGIVPRSVWTLRHRPKCAPEGMAYVGSGLWADIYLSSDDGNGGLQSAYNATPLTGTEGHNWYSFNDRAMMKGKRLMDYDEWCRAGYGSPQGNAGDNVNAWSATTNTGRNPTGQALNAVGALGLRDICGNVWEWLKNIVTNPSHLVLNGTTSPATITYESWDGGRGGQTNNNGTNHGPTTNASNGVAPATGAWNYDRDTPLGDTTGGNPNNGNVYELFDRNVTALLGGGAWTSGASCGCRAVHVLFYGVWHVGTGYGVRLACDSL